MRIRRSEGKDVPPRMQALHSMPERGSGPALEMRTWSAEDVETFIDHVANDRLYAMWVFLLTTGVRRGEVAGLRWEDVDLIAGRVQIRQTRVAVGYDVDVGQPKTARSKRSLALDPATVEVLRAHRTAQLEERLFCGPAWQECGLVFVAPDGAPLHPDRITKLFDRAVLESGLRRIRLHDVRHTHATLALAAGVHPKVVSDRLGHSSTTVTLDVYSHVTPRLQEEAATTIASLFMQPRRGQEDEAARSITAQPSAKRAVTKRRTAAARKRSVSKMFASGHPDRDDDQAAPPLTSDASEPEKGIEPLTCSLRVSCSAV